MSNVSDTHRPEAKYSILVSLVDKLICDSEFFLPNWGDNKSC